MHRTEAEKQDQITLASAHELASNLGVWRGYRNKGLRDKELA